MVVIIAPEVAARILARHADGESIMQATGWVVAEPIIVPRALGMRLLAGIRDSRPGEGSSGTSRRVAQ